MSDAVVLDMRPTAFSLHLVFAFPPLATMTIVESPIARAISGALLFLSLFSLVHDAMHRSLGLSSRANELVLSIGAVLIGVSGTAVRATHFVHHARPGAPDDIEGKTLRLSLWRAVLVSPFAYFELMIRAGRHVRPRARRRQWMEWGCCVVALSVAMSWGGAPRTYALVVCFAQLTIQVWASHLPHHPPALVLSLGRALAWTRIPLVSAFVFHDLHHRRADLSSFELFDHVSAYGG